MALQQMCKDEKHEMLRITSLFTSLVLCRECAFKCVMLEILFYFQINKLIHYLCDLHVQGFPHNVIIIITVIIIVIIVLNSRSLISTNRYVLFLRYGVNKTPHFSRTFRRILLVCIKTVFYNSVIFVSIPMVFSLFSRALAGVPRAPNGTPNY